LAEGSVSLAVSYTEKRKNPSNIKYRIVNNWSNNKATIFARKNNLPIWTFDSDLRREGPAVRFLKKLAKQFTEPKIVERSEKLCAYSIWDLRG